MEWRDCEKFGHENDCYVAVLGDGSELYDCEDLVV